MTFIKHKKQIKCGMWLSWKPDESFVKNPKYNINTNKNKNFQVNLGGF